MRTEKRKQNGEGTIYFVEKEGKWRAEISWVDSLGKKCRKTWKSKKQSEVKAKLTEFKRELLLKGTEATPESETTFQEFADEWVNTILKPKVKPLSFERKVSTLEHQVYPRIGGVPINKLTHV